MSRIMEKSGEKESFVEQNKEKWSRWYKDRGIVQADLPVSPFGTCGRMLREGNGNTIYSENRNFVDALRPRRHNIEIAAADPLAALERSKCTIEEKANKMRKTIVLLLGISFVSFLAACGGSKETTLSGDEKDAVLAFSEAKTDNLLAGMNANDYAAFSKDFDQDMLNAMTHGEFDKLKTDRDTKLGLYVSRQVSDVRQSGDFIAVIYDAVFEKDDDVIVRVVYRAADPHEVSGLWFNK